MVGKEERHFEIASYVLGVASIIFGILQPVFGFGFGLTGLFLLKKKDELSRKARKLNLIGIVVSVIVYVLGATVVAYFYSKGLVNLPAG